MIQAPLRVRNASRREGEFLMEGFLGCTDPVCGAAYPVVDGVPVVLKDVGNWWRQAKPAMSEARAVGPEIRGYFEALEGSGPEGIDGRSLLGSYMDFHFGQFTGVSAAPDPSNGASNGAYWEKVVGMARPGAGSKYSKSVDLGCSVGRFTFEAARFSGLSVGLDLDFGKVSAAAGIQRKRIVAYERRERGRTFRPVEGMYDPPRNVLFLVGDALDPPFLGETFDLVGALNLLDNVGVPMTLLGQADALLGSHKFAGLLILDKPGPGHIATDALLHVGPGRPLQATDAAGRRLRFAPASLGGGGRVGDDGDLPGGDFRRSQRQGQQGDGQHGAFP